MLSGDNSILQKATDAKEYTERASIIEQARTDILGQIAENKGENISKDQLKAILNIYFEDISTLELPDDLSDTTKKLTAKAEYGGYSNIALSDIYNGMFRELENSQIEINISSPGSLGEYYLGFTGLYDKSTEDVLIQQLIATGEIDYMSSDGESVPTTEEVRNAIQSYAAIDGFSFEEELSRNFVDYNIIPSTITITASGETNSIPYTMSGFRAIGNSGDENSYTIIIESNGKRGEKTVTLTTPAPDEQTPMFPEIPGGST